MAGQVIQDVSVNIGADSTSFESAIKRVLVGNQEIQQKLRETAEKGDRYSKEQARSADRIKDAEAAKVAAIKAGEDAVVAAEAKSVAASQRAAQAKKDEAATRSKLAAIIAADENKTSVAAINRVAKAKISIDASLAREQSAAAKSIAAEQEVAAAKLRAMQIPFEQEQHIAAMRESEARRVANILIAEENRLAGLYLRNQATLEATAEKERRERDATAKAAQREADIKQRAADEAVAAAEREAAAIAAAKAKEIAAAEAAAAKEAAAAFRAAEAQAAAAKQAAAGRRFAIQNMAFQVQDVFAQAQFNGFGRAIATQLPQMLGSAGLWGALAGAAVSILAPLAMKLFETGDEAEKAGEKFDGFEQQVDELASSVDGLRAANDAALEPLDKMKEKYGALTEEVIEHRKQLLELAKAETRDDLRNKITGFREVFGDPAEYFRAAKELDDARQRLADLQSGKTKIESGPIGLGGYDPLQQAMLEAEAAEARFQPLLDALAEARTSLKLTDDQAKLLFKQFDAVNLAAGPDVLLGQLRDIQATLRGSRDETGNMSSEAIKLSGVIESLIGQLIEQTTEIKRSDDAARGLADTADRVNFDRARASLASLVGEIQSASAAVASMMASLDQRIAIAKIQTIYANKPMESAGAVAEAEVHAKYKGLDPETQREMAGQISAEAEAARQKAMEAYKAEFDRDAAIKKYQDSIKPVRPGGGTKGGGASKEERDQQKRDERELNELMRESGQITESVRTEEEKRAAALEHIAELQRGGMLGMSEAEMERIAGLPQAERAAEIAKNQERNAEVAAQALQAVNEQYSGLSDAQSTVKDGARDVFRSIITGAGGAQDALANLANRLSSLFADKAFDSIWGAISGSIGGGTGGGLGKILSFIPGFASGTDSAPGGLALVGERGPELVNLARGSQVITADRTRQIMAGGTSRMAQAEVVIRAAEGVTVEQVRQISGDVAVRVSGQAAKAQSRAFGGIASETNRRGTTA